MRCSLKNLFFPLMLAACCLPAVAQRVYNLGTSASPDEIKIMDHVVGPAGKELPAGSGTAKEGSALFARHCAKCHGPNGQGGGMASRLVASEPGSGKFVQKSATNYYPYATIAWDYINRAMPGDKPGSLSADEVYAVTAYLLFKNGIIMETDSMDAKSLPKIQMPNRNGFGPAMPVWPAPLKPSWY
jgi:mono/diheme cytochrome c family protein